MSRNSALPALLTEAMALQADAAYAEALLLYERAIKIAPWHVEAHRNHGIVLHALGQADRAVQSFARAIGLAPSYAPSHFNLGNVLRSLGDLDAALPLLEAAATDGGADALNNLALAHSDAGQLDEAEALFTRALAADPGHADAAYNRATARLLAGRYREGWPGFELRWQRRRHMAPFALATPRWDGAPTTRHLLLHAEQGLGDTIMAARFLPHIAAPHLTVVVPQTLLMLLRPLAPRANWLPLEHGIPPHDCNAALMSLPAILDLDEAGLGAPPYLHVPEHRVAQWRARLADLPGRRIGLAWAGNPGYAGDAARSIAPGLLAALSESRNASFVSLQRGDAPPFVMTDWTGELTDMSRTAALVAALDLVITVDTAIAHLAGALGRPVWLLNRFAPCWRWPLGREDNPWYATLRQFRQPAPGDWPGVIAAVRAALNGERLHRLGGDFRHININAEPRPGRHMHEPA
ncbi:MAG: tetratricopeptide repeat-containing glycosyltransferase family protein [Alphaproteobacteria bacterium]|nr:tetratricopeptide repeat-containing glycosyltransferase family protein [Alphaproteobacteria bacterium]